jgi:hypothetical protein
MHEYAALREEVTTALQTQHQALAFGAATVGLIAGGAFQLKDATSAALVFIGAVPLVCLLVIVIWFGELARMMRAGRYLDLIESAVRAALVDHGLGPGSAIFSWQQYLRESKTPLDRQFRFSYYAVVLLFAALAASSILFGMYQVNWDVWAQWVGFPLIGLVLAGWLGLSRAVGSACGDRSTAAAG